MMKVMGVMEKDQRKETRNKKIIPLYDIIEKNIMENETLSKLRDTLLPKLMNGEINLDKIEC